jgi:iron(III) transport system permease protein
MRVIASQTLLPPARGPWLAASAEVLGALALLPLAAAVAFSLASHGGTSGYAYWWGTQAGWLSLGRTLGLAALAATFAVSLAWLVAAASSRLPARWAMVAAYLACLPMLLPSSLLATAWIFAFGRQGAAAQFAAGALGGAAPSVYSFPAAALVLALRYFGLAALVLVHDSRRREAAWPAARVFRVAPLAAAVHLHLRPAIRPTLAGWLLVALFAMNDHIIPGMLLISTYGTQVLIQYQALLDPAGAAALAAPVAAVGAAALALALASARRTWMAVDRPALALPRPENVAARVVAVATSAAVLALALAVPVATLAYKAGSWRALADALAAARNQVAETVLLALVAGGLCMIAGAVLATRWVNAWREGRWTAAPLVLVNLTVPPSLLAIGILQLTNLGPLASLDGTVAPLVFAYVARFLPVVTLLFFVLWRDEPVEPAAAARTHGVALWRTLTRVVWPRRREALVAGGLLGGLLAATELEVSILLAPPGASTLGVRLYSLIHTAPEAMTSALALDTLLAAAPAIAILGWLMARQARRGEGAQ